MARHRSRRNRSALSSLERLLSDRAGIPWERPSEGLRARIDRAVDETSPFQSPIPLELPWLRSRAWPHALAAALVLAAAGGIGWLASRPSPAPRASMARADTSAPAFAGAPSTSLSLGHTVQEDRQAASAPLTPTSHLLPLVREVELFRADAQRTLGEVFSRIPIFDPR
jgi:hypothetical protein